MANPEALDEHCREGSRQRVGYLDELVEEPDISNNFVAVQISVEITLN